ncbi:unnamed protein product [Ambrosiozyma monospora]|uniref:Unnamed protein product n=1 Tax=Ambrosiozyma monospora TaxID=43982 RepID=A0ACB5TD92_AMBMO|nr:unnamed protein product [Ambrosiozyma monospora]
MPQLNTRYHLHDGAQDMILVPIPAVNPIKKEFKSILIIFTFNLSALLLNRMIIYLETSSRPVFGWRLSFQKARLYRCGILSILSGSMLIWSLNSKSMAELPFLLNLSTWIFGHAFAFGLRRVLEAFNALYFYE